MKKKTCKTRKIGTVKRLQNSYAIIAVERDKLRLLVRDAQSILSGVEEAADLILSAIDWLKPPSPRRGVRRDLL